MSRQRRGAAFLPEARSVGWIGEVVHFHVSRECWLGHEQWLQVGLKLYASMARRAGHLDQDFLMLVGDGDLNGFRKRMNDEVPGRHVVFEGVLGRASPIKDQRGRPYPLRAEV